MSEHKPKVIKYKRLKAILTVLSAIAFACWYFFTPPFGIIRVGQTNDISGCTKFGFEDYPEEPPQTPSGFKISPSEAVLKIHDEYGSCGTKLIWSEIWADDRNYYIITRGAFDFSLRPYSMSSLRADLSFIVDGQTGVIQQIARR